MPTRYLLCLLLLGCPKAEDSDVAPVDDTDAPDDTDVPDDTDDTDLPDDTDTGEPADPRAEACAAAAVDFDVPATRDLTSGTVATFDGSAIWVGWNETVGGSVALGYLARFACDGTLLAGPIKIGGDLPEARIVEIVPGPDEGVVVLVGSHDPDADAWKTYTQRFDTAVTPLALEEVATEAATAFPRALVVHDGGLAAGLSVVTTAGSGEVVFVGLTAEGATVGDLGRYEFGQYIFDLGVTSTGNALRAAWIDVTEDWDQSLVTVTIGEEPVTHPGYPSGYATMDARNGHVVTVWDDPLQIRRDDGASLKTTDFGEPADVALHPDGSGIIAVRQAGLVFFDATVTSTTTFRATGVRTAEDVDWLAGDTWIVAGSDSEDQPRIAFVKTP
jgi:hypothetical protein